MSKTNPVMLNGAGVTADGAMLKDGDEVVFPQGESERLVFRYQLVAAAAAAAKAFSPAAPPRSPLGERNNGVVAAKSPVSKKAATPENKAAATPSKSPAKKAPTPAKSPAKKAPTPAKSPAKNPAKSPAKKAPTPKSAGPTPHTRAARALVADAVENLVAAEAAEAVEAAAESPAAESPAAKSPAAKSPAVSAKKSPAARKAATPKSAGPTPHTAASRALVDAAIENLTAAEQAESAVLAASPVAATKSPAKKATTPAKSPAKKAATPAKSPAKKAPTPKSAGPTPHTRAARALVADAVENLVAAEAAEAVEAAAESPAAESPAAKSPASGPTPHTRAARDIVAAAVAAVVADEADVAMAEASPAKSPAKKRKAAVGFASPAKSPGIPKSPRPSLKAPEMRIGAVPPGSAQRRKSLRFVADADMEQVRFIPPHNGEPELCGRIAPNQHVSLEKRKRTPNKRYADAEEEADEEMPDAAVNRVGDVGHTGPIPKFTAVVAEEAAASPKSGGRKRSLPLSSPLSTGGSKRAAVSFTIGQAEVTDDVAGTPVEQKALRAGSGCAKRKGTPAPPSRAEEEEEEEEEEEALLEENVDVTVVEEGILGSGRSDAAPSSVAGTEDFASEAAGDTADDIPVFRLGDVGNTGPIPQYSPACKASPSVVAEPLSAIKSPGCIEADSENAFHSEKAFPASASENTPRSLRRSRRSSAGARSTAGSVAGATPGTAPRPAAPANTPATGAWVTSGNALLAGLEGYAEKLARTPGGHAELGAVARILVDEADDEADDEEKEIAVNVTVEEEIEGATEFVLEAEAAAAIEAAEAAAEAGAAAAAEAEGDDFDFDEAFAADAALVAEGVADVEAVAEIEAALEKTKTPEKVAAWLEANLAEVEVEMAAKSPKSAAAKSPRSKSPKSAAAESPAAKSPMNVLPRDSPALEIIRARGGVAGGRAYGGLSARVAQLHRPSASHSAASSASASGPSRASRATTSRRRRRRRRRTRRRPSPPPRWLRRRRRRWSGKRPRRR